MKKWVLLSLLCLTSLVNYASPLPAAEVFKVNATQIDPNTLSIHWQVKPGYFLYSDRIKIDVPSNSNVHLGTIRFPQTLMKIDKQGRTYPIYRNELSLPVPILGEQPGETLLDVHFQGCADDGFCYPPETRQIKLAIGNDLALTSVSMEETPVTVASTSSQETDDIEAVFSKEHWIMVVLTFFGFGLLLAFTPCVLPMVPVLSGIIVGHGKDLSTRKAFFLSLSYVLSMSVTYALVGALVASLGSNLQVIMQSPWIIVTFSLIFVLLALSMFGCYDLRLPVSWQAKLANISRRQGSGHYVGAAVMGSLSTLILSPCVTAPLIGALGYIAHSGNILFGTLTLFFLGLGMGTPLLLIGASAGKWLPKAGTWMNTVKAFFGVLLLGVAIYLLDRILPSTIVMILWASLLIFTGIYCGALTIASSNHAKLRQGLGIMSLVYGLLILVGASMGSHNPLQPLAGFQATANAAAPGFTIETVKSIDEVQQAISKAKGKPVMLDFYADWCASCQTMEATTFKDARVEAALRNFVVLKVDITANNAQDKALLKAYGVVAPPTFLFFNKQGKEESKLRVVGETSASKFLEQLTRVTALD
ncbi:thiol:disulfide interchange protein DsbD [Legionella lansingensis]|uniref:Thiol:disulfide interchange protein DsbD n=1 Tax=Legionella lansingensis TaxID=45067 RepID=A0A0W0VIL8_9GAMM|nr:protein-disulfide reductase DsbD [Legionella lansingensis]KTD19946.1 thiol:disulfide interchange protein DsbD [Legionella lansingensis]SNV48515.1 thiol:disulfide interchange protein DsbD [Legionella lansingensis]